MDAYRILHCDGKFYTPKLVKGKSHLCTVGKLYVNLPTIAVLGHTYRDEHGEPHSVEEADWRIVCYELTEVGVLEMGGEQSTQFMLSTKDRIQQLIDNYSACLSGWELKFLNSVRDQPYPLTQKQNHQLDKIEREIPHRAPPGEE